MVNPYILTTLRWNVSVSSQLKTNRRKWRIEKNIRFRGWTWYNHTFNLSNMRSKSRFIFSILSSCPPRVSKKKQFYAVSAPVSRAGRRSWGTIVLSRERTERSRTIPPFQKKNERIERVLKNIGTICKGTERERSNWKKRNANGTI